jgi:non-specific serine/threonine protein kinase
VLPLEAPSANQLPSVDDLLHYEAITLFVDRARSKLPNFSLDSQNAQAVAGICSRLEGIPLAIELAAARVTALAVDEIAKRFENSLDLLSSGNRTADHRHRTLRATLEWSYRLLSARERTLFGRLSVFTGGWALEAAEAVGAADEHGVLEILIGLVEKSLVVAEVVADGELRYRMLEPIRQYGRERLEASGEDEQTRERHATYYTALVEEQIPELMGPRPVACLERLEVEYDNLRAALGWYLDESAETEKRTEMGLRLATNLGRFWNTYGPEEGRRWLERGLSRSHVIPDSLRAQALGEAGFIAIFQADPHAMELLDEGLALSRKLGDKSGLALSVSSLGHAVGHAEDHDRLATLREEAELLLRAPLDQRARAHLLLFLGVAAMSQGNPKLVSLHTNKALALFRKLGDIRHVAMSLGVIGLSAIDQGDHEQAAVVFEEDMRLLRELRDKTGIVYGLLGVAGVAALKGQSTRASKLCGASEILRESFGLPLTPMVRDHYDYEGLVAAARAGLDEAAFRGAWSEGRAMSPEQAIDYALGTDKPPSIADTETKKMPDRESPDVLTRRQREVVILVAQGLTNRQVAGELSISEHTVATHVREILKALRFGSRTQLAAWAAEQDASVPR